jgi:hypothetical protein
VAAHDVRVSTVVYSAVSVLLRRWPAVDLFSRMALPIIMVGVEIKK